MLAQPVAARTAGQMVERQAPLQVWVALADEKDARHHFTVALTNLFVHLPDSKSACSSFSRAASFAAVSVLASTVYSRSNTSVRSTTTLKRITHRPSRTSPWRCGCTRRRAGRASTQRASELLPLRDVLLLLGRRGLQPLLRVADRVIVCTSIHATDAP